MKAKTLFRTTQLLLVLVMVAIALGCSGSGSGVGTLSQAVKEGNIYIGDIPFEAPLLFQRNQQMVGPEAALGAKIAELVGQEVEREVAAFWVKREGYASLAPTLLEDANDFIISAYGINEERQKQLAFSKPYYKSELVMMVSSLPGQDLDSSGLAGRIIAVRQGTVAAEKVRAKFPDAQFLEVDTIDNGVLAVRSGQAAAMIDDRYMLAFSLATLTGAQGLEIVDEVIETVDFAVAVRKEETRVLELVNRAVDEMMGQNYLALLDEHLSDQDYQAVLKRRPDRISREQQAKKRRSLTIRVRRASGSDFDIYRFANLSFYLVDAAKGTRVTTSSKIDFKGGVGTCSASVAPGNYRLVLQKFNFSPGNVVIAPTDKDRVTVNVAVQPDGNFVMTRGD